VRFCYAIQSHRSPAQLLRLVRQIRRMSPDSVIHVSHDRAGAPLDTAAFAAVGGVIVEFHQGGYGDFSHVDRYLAAVDRLVSEGVRVDWLANLTGQDYPVRHLAAGEAEVARSTVDGFMEHWPALGPDSHWGARKARSRYHFHYRRVLPLSPLGARLLRPLQAINRVQPLLRVNASYGLVLGRRVRTPFGPDLVLHGGSAYSTLSWAAVEYLRGFLHDRPDVLAHFRPTLSPEEAIFQTILASSGTFRLDPDCKRYFDFSGSRFNHSRVLTLADLPAAWASGAHFARKIDGDRHPEVLDALDDHLAAYDR